MADRQPTAPDPLGRRAVAPALLFAAVFALYAHSASFNFIYDDGQLILGQPMPRSALDVAAVFTEPHWPGLPYYRPVTRATMVLQKWIHGDVPGPFHLFNAALMGLTAVLTFALLRLPAFGVRPVPALLGAALFCMHPIASTTVYPICSGRETLVPTFFIVASLYAFLRPGAGWTALATAFAALSLLSKESGVVVPAAFVLADLLRLTPDPPGRDLVRWIRRYAPLAALGIGYLCIRWVVFSDSGREIRIAFLDEPLTPLLTLAYTLQTTFAPFVELVYEPRVEAWWSTPRMLGWLAGVALLAVGVVRTGPVRRPAVLFWLGFWVLAQLPTANLLRQESPFAERYGFLALLAVVGIAADVASRLWDRPHAPRAIAAAAILLLVPLAATSFHRGRYFANDQSFSHQWVRTDPDSYKAQLRLGHGYERAGQFERAAVHLAKAAAIEPDDPIVQNGLGYALWRAGDLDAAAVHLRLAVDIAPHFTVALLNLADVLIRLGSTEAAVEHYRRALEIAPDDVRGHHHLARALHGLGRDAMATRHYERVLLRKPHSAGVHVELGEVLEARGDHDGARRHFEAALEIRPEMRRARRGLDRLGAIPAPDEPPE